MSEYEQRAEWNEKAAVGGMLRSYRDEEAPTEASAPLQDALGVLDRNVDQLMKMAEVLRGRLSPVMRPSEPTAIATDDGAKTKDPRRESPIVSRVRETSARISSTVTRMERMVSWLDL